MGSRSFVHFVEAIAMTKNLNKRKNMSEVWKVYIGVYYRAIVARLKCLFGRNPKQKPIVDLVVEKLTEQARYSKRKHGRTLHEIDTENQMKFVGTLGPPVPPRKVFMMDTSSMSQKEVDKLLEKFKTGNN